MYLILINIIIKDDPYQYITNAFGSFWPYLVFIMPISYDELK